MVLCTMRRLQLWHAQMLLIDVVAYEPRLLHVMRIRVLASKDCTTCRSLLANCTVRASN